MKILIADDEIRIRNGIVNHCDWKSLGITEILVAENGIEAYDIVCAERPQLILTDIKMPYMSGLELCKKVSETHPKCKIILLSGYDAFQYAKEALTLGVVDYLLKPATAEAIVETVRCAIEKIREDEKERFRIKQLEQQLDSNRVLLKEHYLNILVNSGFYDEKILDANLEFLGINFKYSKFFVFVISLDDFSESEQWRGLREVELIKCGIRNIVSELTETRGYISEIFATSSGDIAVVINGEWDMVNQAEVSVDLADECRRCIEEYMQVTITIGVGCEASDITLLPVSCVGAEEAVRYKTVAGKNCVIHFNDIKLKQSEPFVYPKHLEDKITDAVLNADRETLERSVKQYFSSLSNYSDLSTTKPEYIKNCCIKLIFILLQRFAQKGFFDEELNIDSFLASLKKSETIQEFYTVLNNQIQSFLNMVDDVLQNNQKNIIFEAKAFAEKNLSSDLTVKTVSKSVYLSPNYFASLFKKATGVNFTDYVANIRIEKAKELLKNQNIKMYEIAQLVGFSDSRYFSQFFRRYTDCTPSEYREQTRKE